jgi:hypothetical protein
VEVDDSTPIQKLSILDQFRVLFKSIIYDPANELRNDDIVTQEYLTRKANLSAFLHKATEPIRKGVNKEVIVNIATEFEPVFEDVIKSREIASFYEVSVVRPKIDYDIPCDFMVRLRVKNK